MDDLELAKRLLESDPKMVALVGKPMFRLSSMLRDPANACSVPQVTEDLKIDNYAHTFRGTDRQISDCVLCMDLPSNSANPQTQLGLACRTSPRLVLVEHSQDQITAELLPDEQFFAFGFRRIGNSTDISGLQTHWYAYSLRDYKQSPKWLNARFWAHPERFDLQD